MDYSRPNTITDERYLALRKRAIRDLATARHVSAAKKDDPHLIETCAAEAWLTDTLVADGGEMKAIEQVVSTFGQTCSAASNPWKVAGNLLVEALRRETRMGWSSLRRPAAEAT
jgi:hypothetical protein